MRKPATLKPKIWGSTATLHFWETGPSGRQPDVGRYGNDNGGTDADVEQISHGRWAGSLDNFNWFNPTILGASPFERRALAARNKYR